MTAAKCTRCGWWIPSFTPDRCDSCKKRTPEVLAAAARLPDLDPALLAFLPRLLNDALMHACIERMEQGGGEGDVGVGKLRFGGVEIRSGRFRIPFEGEESYQSAMVGPPRKHATSGWIEVDRDLQVHGAALGGWVIPFTRTGGSGR